MRYFEIVYPSKKTIHPDGEKKVTIYEKGKHKKQACEFALMQLEDLEKKNVAFFKLPIVTKELTLEEFEIITIDKQPPAKKTKHKALNAACEGFSNDEEIKGITVQQVNIAIASVMLFDHQKEYTTRQKNEVREFVENPIVSGTTEELREYTDLITLIMPLMPLVFDKLNEGMLFQLVKKAVISLKTSKVPVNDLIMLISNDWGIQMQGEISQSDYVDVAGAKAADRTAAANKAAADKAAAAKAAADKAAAAKAAAAKAETDKAAAAKAETDKALTTAKKAAEKITNEPINNNENTSFVLPAYKTACSFDDDLEELNDKLDNLDTGESLIINGLSNELYHASGSYSKSSLDFITRAAGLLQWAADAPSNPDKDHTFIFGSAFHSLVLEPEHFYDQYMVMPPLNLRTNDGRAEKANLEQIAKNKRMSILSHEELSHLQLMRGSVYAHPVAKLLLKKGVAEQSIFYRLSSNLVVRIRPDWVTDFKGRKVILDLKSCPDAAKFEKSVEEYRYHVQDAFYSHIYELATGIKPLFLFCATGKTICMGKYPTRICNLENYDKEVGLVIALNDVDTLQQSINTAVWGGVETISRPNWARRLDQI